MLLMTFCEEQNVNHLERSMGHVLESHLDFGSRGGLGGGGGW